jgi:hypothetical protein
LVAKVRLKLGYPVLPPGGLADGLGHACLQMDRKNLLRSFQTVRRYLPAELRKLGQLP